MAFSIRSHRHTGSTPAPTLAQDDTRCRPLQCVPEPLRFPQAWYPLCRAGDLRTDKPLTIHAFGTRLLAWRDAAGHTHVLHAHCAHMGGDLSRGSVIDGRVQCPLHHWQYDGTGRCVQIPSGEPIPRDARVASLPSTQRYGLVFAFLGAQADYPLPTFDDQDAGIYGRATVMDIDVPLMLFGVNGFDAQHYASVHRRPLSAPANFQQLSRVHCRGEFQSLIVRGNLHDRIMLMLGLKRADVRIDCWGGNHFLMTVGPRESLNLFSVLPVDAQRSRVFVLVIGRRDGRGLMRRLQQRVLLFVTQVWFLHFLKQDIAAFRQLEFAPRHLLPIADACLSAWLNYWNNLPRQSIADLTAPTHPAHREVDIG